MAEHVGLFFPLPKRLARQYPPDGRAGEDPSPPHLTFVYIGDFDESGADELIATAKRIGSVIPPLDLKLENASSFQNDEGQTIINSPVSGQHLHPAHYGFKTALKRRGFEVADKWPVYKPHVTIEYVDSGEQPRYGMLNPRGQWRADAVELWGLGDPIKIPLGPRHQVHAKRDIIRTLLEHNHQALANAVAYSSL
jgi:2'-5' RNA ligase